MERSRECVAIIADAPQCDGRRRAIGLRQKQFAAALDPHKRLEIARRISVAKLRTLNLSPSDPRAFRAELDRVTTLETILTAEARAGGAYWMRWRGFEIDFRDEVPEHWRVFVMRGGAVLRGRIGTSKARNAIMPLGECLNYAFTVALGQCTRAIVGLGIDPTIGFLHSPRQGRLSLSYDVLEFHRAAITEAVFEFSSKRVFRWKDFELDLRGVVRLSAPLAREVAAMALREVSMVDCTKTVRRIAAWF
jgi:CRISPR-associated endonuclease Cas1